MLPRNKLTQYLNKLLKPYNFTDYGPNGLQIEGTQEIKKIAFCVSATKESIEQAIIENADTIITHHGLFWNFHGTKTITGAFGKRVKPIIKNEINLFGYHLPLDANLEMGNAAMLGKLLGLDQVKGFGDYKKMPTGIKGQFKQKIKVSHLQVKLEKILNHSVILSSHDLNQEVSSIGIITGGANSSWSLCLKENLDCYLTGEISEHDWHDAQENEIHMFAGGHHATERFGIIALEEKINKEFKNEYKIQTLFIDSDNPV